MDLPDKTPAGDQVTSDSTGVWSAVCDFSPAALSGLAVEPIQGAMRPEFALKCPHLVANGPPGPS
jgi:hypothetical protein